MQAASASRCFQPPDSAPVNWSARAVKPSSSSVRSTAFRRFGMPYIRATKSRFSRMVRSSQYENFWVM